MPADAEVLHAGNAPEERATISSVSGHARARALVDEHIGAVSRAMRRLGVSGDSLDDAVQQTFIVATRKLGIIEVGGERAYLLGIAVRVAADVRRARRRRREVPAADDGTAAAGEPDAPSVEELVDQKRALETLDGILATLPDDLREVFVLFELEGLALKEIAAMLGIPSGTVASRLRRGRETFHKRVLQTVRPPKGRAP
jgi:RNA polymerase sigma-70 factor (ECF subfamily)